MDDRVSLIVEQFVLQQLLGRETIFWVFIEAAHEEIIQNGRCIVSLSDAQVWLLGSDSVIQVSLISSHEWKSSTRQQYVSEHTECPNVNAIIIFLSIYDLWSHIERGAKSFRRSLTRIQDASEAEIGQLADYDRRCIWMLFYIDHDVLHLEISMNDALFVHVIQGHHNLFNKIGSVFLIEIPIILDDIFLYCRQISLLQQFHGTVKMGRII